MKRFFAPLLIFAMIVHCSFAAPKIEYGMCFKGYYDSNIGQNSAEYPGFYAVPEAYSNVNPIKPITVHSALAYDGFLIERDINDLSPLATLGVETKLGEKILSSATDLTGSLTYGQNRVATKDTALQAADFALLCRTITLTERVKSIIENHEISLRFGTELQDYGDYLTDSGTARNEEDAINYTLKPSYHYLFSTDLAQPIYLSTIGIAATYQNHRARIENHSWQKFLLIGELSVQWRAAVLATELNVVYKKYGKKIEITENQDLISGEYTGITLSPAITYPMAPQFSLIGGGSYHFRTGNSPDYTFTRYTVTLGIEWNASVKFSNKEKHSNNTTTR